MSNFKTLAPLGLEISECLASELIFEGQFYEYDNQGHGFSYITKTNLSYANFSESY